MQVVKIFVAIIEYLIPIRVVGPKKAILHSYQLRFYSH